MRRSAIRRRMNRADVPIASAASSTVNSESTEQLLGRESRSGDSAGSPGDAALLAGVASDGGGQSGLARGLVAGPPVGPLPQHHHGLDVVLVLVDAEGVVAVLAGGPGGAGAAQRAHGGGVAAALGRPVAAEAEHVCPRP